MAHPVLSMSDSTEEGELNAEGWVKQEHGGAKLPKSVQEHLVKGLDGCLPSGSGPVPKETQGMDGGGEADMGRFRDGLFEEVEERAGIDL